MTAPRLSANDRRASIIAAAGGVFARYGFEGARTQQIAQAAGVSEALVFRHFESKLSLYRAVLRQIVREQNAAFSVFGDIEPSAAGLIDMIDRAISHALTGASASNGAGMRVVIGSLAGDAGYARLVYHRAMRLALPGLTRAMAAARDEGHLTGEPLAPANVAAFIEHVATMMMLAHMPHPSAIPYSGCGTALKRDAVRFCARGLGLDAKWVETKLR